ncbi:MAG: zinc-binding dehydrogenase [Betaproteobacteria bacterium]|nr:zinc-binding dehydrogenase [Betaproteobacteria bacterium]
MPYTSKTAALTAPRTFSLIERTIPMVAPDHVVVRIAATAVCHTDLGIYKGAYANLKYPVVMGHESTGVVEAAGDTVSHLKRGDPVIINPIISCGHCDMCQRDMQNLCRNAGLFGREVDGSLAELVHVAAKYAHPLPADIALDDATLIETLATVKHAQDRLGIKAGESVVVLGQGTTGLLHTQLAALAGANPVIAISRTRWKLDMATRMGAHHALDVSAEKALSEVMRLTGNHGADVVIDTAGGAATLQAAIDMIKPGGRLSPYAVSHECCTTFTTFPLYFKEISIIGSRALHPTDMAPSIDLVRAGKIDVKGFVSGTFPLGKTPEAFKAYEGNSNGVLRLVIDSRAS